MRTRTENPNAPASRGLRWLGIAGGILFVAEMAISGSVMFKGAQVSGPIIGACITVFMLASVVLGFRVVADRRLNRQTRQAWAWIAPSFVLMLIANVLWAQAWSGFPAPPDYVRLAATPVIVIGLLRLPMRAGRRQRSKVALDAGTVATAACAFLWYLQLGPSLLAPGATAARLIAGMLYPLGDIVLVFGIAVVLMRGADAAVRGPVRLLAVAAVPWVVSDVAIGYHNSHPGTTEPFGWQMVLLLTAHAILAAAAYMQIWQARRTVLILDEIGTARVSRLPYVAVVAVSGLLFYVAVKEHALYPWGGLVLCAFVLTALVGFRQMMAQRENHRMAITDGLTGLANRVRLHESLQVILGRAGRQDETTAVLLCDLNGFKQVNDTMGHEAGDRLLVAYGGMLRSATMGSDVAARLGGDEFAVVLHNIGTPENAVAVARRILKETETPVMIGDAPIQVRGSIGIALSGPGELALDELMRRADIAMYEAKRTKAGTFHVYEEPSVAVAAG
jgi:diguanylate cyclase (GGDEF)-like protein